MNPISLADDVRARCEEHPQFEGGSAYDRTKICCDVLIRLGHPIPSWMVIRDYIGKGSATDIRRAVGDFRKEHADLLRQMNGVPAALPERLAPAVTSLWQAAVSEATASFADRIAIADQLVAQAEDAASRAVEERDVARTELALRAEKIVGLEVALAQSRDYANAERAAREQAERTTAAHVTDLTIQRDTLRQSIDATVHELQALAKRAEGERHRALMEIEHARQQVATARQEALHEGERRLAARETELRKEIADLNIDYVYLQRKHAELQEQAANLRELVNTESRTKTGRRASASRPPTNTLKLTRLRRR